MADVAGGHAGAAAKAKVQRRAGRGSRNRGNRPPPHLPRCRKRSGMKRLALAASARKSLQN